MSDIFTITYEEAVKNGITIMNKGRFQTYINAMRYFCKQNKVFYPKHKINGYYLSFRNIALLHDNEYIQEVEKIFEIKDFNNITVEQFHMLKENFRDFGDGTVIFFIRLQSYFKGEEFLALEKENNRFLIDKTIIDLKQKNNELKDKNSNLKKENDLLKKQLKQYETKIKQIEKFKKETYDFLEKI